MQLARIPAAYRRIVLVRLRAMKWNSLHNYTLCKTILACWGPAGNHGDHLAVSRLDILCILGLLLRRDTFLIDDDLLTDYVEVLLAVTIECDLIARLELDQILKDLPISADMAGQHNITIAA